jgi:hypothetical protein
VLGHLRLIEAEHVDEVIHGPFPAGEDVQDLPPPRLGHCVERVCCRRCSCHVGDHIPISEYVNRKSKFLT